MAKKLIEQKHQVTILDNFSTGRIKNIENISVQVQHKNVLKVTSGIDKFDVVFHLAAKPFSKANINWFDESNSIFQTNVVGTYNILRLINQNCHFIFTSSASVYGEGRRLEEESPYRPLSAYGYSKMMAEQIIINSPRIYTIVRPATIIGPRGRCFPNRVMWSIVKNNPCKFFKNGQVLRDIIDVNDVTSALTEIMNQKVLGIFNLGTNTEILGVELGNVASKIANEWGMKLKTQFTSFVPSDFVTKSTLNSTKLHTTLKWQPEYNLYRSLSTIFDYYHFNSNIKEPPSWDSL